MQISKAVEIIQSLADGVDPITGELYGDNSPYQNPQITRALFAALKALEKSSKQQERYEKLPLKAGQSWSAEEDKMLCDSFDRGQNIGQLATQHERTESSIRSRLIKKGKIAS